MLTPHETIRVALDLLTQGLFPYFRDEMTRVHGPNWVDAARSSLRQERLSTHPRDAIHWDAQALLSVMWDQWNEVFRQRMGLFERSLVSELREYRNGWAHQIAFNEDDAYRVLDTVQRLLAAAGSPDEHLEELESLKLDTLRRKLGRTIDDDLRRARSNRERYTEIVLYSIAGTAVILSTMVALTPKNPLAGYILCGFTTLVFAYLILNRLKAPLTLHGVHECPKCRKIIYNEVCPYCEAPHSSSILRGASSSSKLPPFRESTTLPS